MFKCLTIMICSLHSKFISLRSRRFLPKRARGERKVWEARKGLGRESDKKKWEGGRGKEGENTTENIHKNRTTTTADILKTTDILKLVFNTLKTNKYQYILSSQNKICTLM
jgi:hypothetical protein